MQRQFAQVAALAGAASEGQAVARLQAETGNLTVMLGRAADAGQTEDLTSALEGLTQYWRFTGYAQPGLARSVAEDITARGTDRQQARALLALAALALARSDHDGARGRYEQALSLYRSIREPCSIGWTLVRLARLEPAGSTNKQWEQARQAWASIGRDDLIASVEGEFK